MQVELLASIIEKLDQVRLTTVDLNGKWKGRRPEPLRIRRPWDPEPEAAPLPSRQSIRRTLLMGGGPDGI